MTITKPKVGQVWSFGPNGRRDTIKSVRRGASGRWSLINGKITPHGKSTAVYVHWKSGFSTISVRSLWHHWIPV